MERFPVAFPFFAFAVLLFFAGKPIISIILFAAGIAVVVGISRLNRWVDEDDRPKSAAAPKQQPARPQAKAESSRGQDGQPEQKTVETNARQSDTPLSEMKANPAMAEKLRDLVRPGTDELDFPQEPSAAEACHLQRIADSFFIDEDRVLTVPSGDLTADRLCVMAELYDYLRASNGDGQRFASDGTTAERGRIRCLRRDKQYKEAYCYDGGCHSDESYWIYDELLIDLVSDSDWDAALAGQGGCKAAESRDEKRWMYRGRLRNDDALVLRANGKLYMHHPFGSVFNFCFSWHEGNDRWW